MVKKLFNVTSNPDICIGVDSSYTGDNLIDFTVAHFKNYGYSVELNKPYLGTIVPNKFINKRYENLQSIMLEINKRCYLNNIDKYFKLKECLNDYYKIIKKL